MTDLLKNLRRLRYLKPGYLRERDFYNKWFKFIGESEYWEKEMLDAWQWGKITMLINHAYENVPYYTRLFNGIGANPKDFKDLSDFRKIPFLTKNIVRENLNDLLPRNYDRKRAVYYTTGGSTGKPLGFYKTRQSDIIEKAFMYHQWKRVGFKENDRRIILRGQPLPENEFFRPIKWSDSWLFSSYQLSPKNIHLYVDKLNEIEPKYLHVYPSSLYVLTKLMKDHCLNLNFSPVAILCGSENLYERQRILFKEFFNAKVYSWLGLAEQTTLAGECEHSAHLHAWPQHSFVELISENNKTIKSPGERGEIIGTNLNNYLTPFIRYKSEDIAVYGGDKCDLCGRQYPLFEKIEGRLQEVIVSINGSYISMVALNMHSDVFDRVHQFQFYQNTQGKVQLNIVRKQDFSDNDKIRIIKEIKDKLGDDFQLQIKYIDTISPTKNGKHRFLRQELPLEFGD